MRQEHVAPLLDEERRELVMGVGGTTQLSGVSRQAPAEGRRATVFVVGMAPRIDVVARRDQQSDNVPGHRDRRGVRRQVVERRVSARV